MSGESRQSRLTFGAHLCYSTVLAGQRAGSAEWLLLRRPAQDMSLLGLNTAMADAGQSRTTPRAPAVGLPPPPGPDGPGPSAADSPKTRNTPRAKPDWGLPRKSCHLACGESRPPF